MSNITAYKLGNQDSPNWPEEIDPSDATSSSSAVWPEESSPEAPSKLSQGGLFQTVLSGVSCLGRKILSSPTVQSAVLATTLRVASSAVITAVASPAVAAHPATQAVVTGLCASVADTAIGYLRETPPPSSFAHRTVANLTGAALGSLASSMLPEGLSRLPLSEAVASNGTYLGVYEVSMRLTPPSTRLETIEEESLEEESAQTQPPVLANLPEDPDDLGNVVLDDFF